ncbi:Ribosomal protein L15, bacterial-type [Syntrophomonas zehnderi OL-4]|uniref:Large ribosomal subunit protein uL15 n=1 Tax=Syntrophomonas zehnderi OL-4 TaxID=690567 RepID=A0A0E4C8A0_9FIRM|nr:50S ribosomal protein L15 [Syntrophomonas zehnderi]CFX04948.1 Ribosomal protein L15, bacterial-type [Syntrophomonas zehnderi OL-4]CFX35462.1 Ribosomal protein L15, bacterial-type [Syntrophomonas zehnderi OL-4]
MKLEEIKSPPGATKSAKRVGRGIGSGHGKTSCRGHKGQKSRSGGGVRPGFEGGQMPLQRRLPKRGFTNIFKTEWSIVNVRDLNVFEEGTVVTIPMLKEAGLIRKAPLPVKLLGDGEIEKKLTIQVNKASQQAEEKIAARGGKVEVI